MNKILVLDVETTGIANHPELGHPEVIELAYAKIDNYILQYPVKTVGDRLELTNHLETLIKIERFKPEMPIHEEAFKVHGILPKELLGKPKSYTCELPEGVEYIVGHNVIFDARCLGLTTRFAETRSVKQICTMGLAKNLNKKFKLDISTFKLDNLNVHFYGEEARDVIKEHHDASTDVIKTILLLNKLIEYIPGITTFEGLYKIQELLKTTKGKK